MRLPCREARGGAIFRNSGILRDTATRFVRIRAQTLEFEWNINGTRASFTRCALLKNINKTIDYH